MLKIQGPRQGCSVTPLGLTLLSPLEAAELGGEIPPGFIPPRTRLYDRSPGYPHQLLAIRAFAK